MLYWSVIFFIIALVAAVLGFGGIAAGAASIAQVLFVVFLVLFLVSLLSPWCAGARPRSTCDAAATTGAGGGQQEEQRHDRSLRTATGHHRAAARPDRAQCREREGFRRAAEWIRNPVISQMFRLSGDTHQALARELHSLVADDDGRWSDAGGNRGAVQRWWLTVRG